MVEVLFINIQRVQTLWPIFLDHITELLGHPKSALHPVAIDALGKAIVGVLARAYKDQTEQGTQVCCTCMQQMFSS